MILRSSWQHHSGRETPVSLVDRRVKDSGRSDCEDVVVVRLISTVLTLTLRIVRIAESDQLEERLRFLRDWLSAPLLPSSDVISVSLPLPEAPAATRNKIPPRDWTCSVSLSE